MEAFKLPSDNKPRYEVLIRKTSDIEFEIQRVHCVQGHMGALLSDQADVKDTREAVHTFVEWDASLMTRPKISPYDMYSVAFERFPLKLGYRGTCMRNCSDVARYRFIPRGLALHGSGARAPFDLCHDEQGPEWLRQDNAGLCSRLKLSSSLMCKWRCWMD